MRPVNLIPPEERRGTGAPTRTGRTPYILLGGLAALIGALALLVSTNASVSDRQAEIAALEVEERDAKARADALRAFATFAATRQAREATIESLARSRFDWERVMTELSRVIPADVWLTELAATASPDVGVEGGPSTPLRGDIPGPALELSGCGRSHSAVAGLIAALEDIDGATRVTATKSSKPDASEAGAASSGTGTGGSSECQTRNSIATFDIAVAFDEAPVPATAAPTGAVPATPPASPPPAAPAQTTTTTQQVTSP